MLEAVVASGALLAFGALLLGLIYFCTLKTYLQYSSHEFLVCREISDPWLCEKKFKRELQSVLRFGQIESMWARQETQRQFLHLHLSFSALQRKISWIYEDEILLPLKGS
jgi:hypothetical protein